MDEQQARETIVKAGLELLESGLLVRSWGNISCRLDGARFAITPSGRAYETLRTGDIVICNTADASWSGAIKPSSEKGAHALIYRLRADAGFVIHTHQRFASAVASLGITAIHDEKMGEIPVAEYSLPGTKKLVRKVKAVLPQANGAVLMSHHGALCYGDDYYETFNTAKLLEEACERFMHNSYMKAAGVKEFDKTVMLDYYVRKAAKSLRFNNQMINEQNSLAASPVQNTVLGIKKSIRDGEGIIAYTANGETSYPSGVSSVSSEVGMHFAIYAARAEINCIELADDEYVAAVSLSNKPLPRYLDDFAQMMGSPMRAAPSMAAHLVLKALGKSGAVLIPGAGALCCAATETDAHALCLVTEKNALAEICAAMFGKAKPLSPFDCFLMHLVYTRKYSKQYLSKGV